MRHHSFPLDNYKLLRDYKHYIQRSSHTYRDMDSRILTVSMPYLRGSLCLKHIQVDSLGMGLLDIQVNNYIRR